MNPREQQLSLNFCHRLYNLMKFLSINAHKMMISGHRMPRRLADSGAATKESSSQLMSGAPPNEDEKAETSFSNPKEKKEAQVEEQEEPKAPKKMVSINENVETIFNTRDKKKGKKKKKKQDILDDSKPLKSILKVSSDVNNISDSPPSLLSSANGA